MKPWSVTHARPRDFVLARRAKKAGAANYALRTVLESRRSTHVPASLGLALIQQESSFRNVFGHDAGGPFPGQAVTAAKVRALLRHIANGGISNGVGPGQLTYPPFIKEAQRDGGAHKPAVNIATAIEILDDNIRAEGGNERRGLARYNAGSGGSAQGLRYAAEVLKHKDHFHRALT